MTQTTPPNQHCWNCNQPLHHEDGRLVHVSGYTLCLTDNPSADPRPPIVCYITCSNPDRLDKRIEQALTAQGYVVIPLRLGPTTPRSDHIDRAKVRMADRVAVLRTTSALPELAKDLIGYARSLGMPIHYVDITADVLG